MKTGHRIVPLNWIQWVTLLLVLGVALGFIYGFTKIEDALSTVHRVQCDAKRNNAAALRASIKFLHEHPNGSADFSRQFILNAIAQDRQRAASLSSLDCQP